MSNEPDRPLQAALASFDALWSPRIVTRVNDYDVRIAKVAGEHVWHVHDNTDEFFLVLDGELPIALREPTRRAERTVHAAAGRGVRRPPRHRAQAVVAGGRRDPDVRADRDIDRRRPARRVPDHVDATTGHALG